MATKVVMEALSPTMEEGRLVEWKKNEGDTVAVGDVLAEVETDKAVMELVARGAGVLLKQVIPVGTTAPVASVVAWIGAAGEAIAEGGAPVPAAPAVSAPVADAAVAPAAAAAPPAPAPASGAQQAAPVPSGAGSRVKASPLAKRIAADRGLDLGGIAGSGPEGRIVMRDLDGIALAPASAFAGVATAVYTDVPLTQMRKAIAKRLVQSIGPIPTFYLTAEVDMERAHEMRESLLAADPKNGKFSFNDLIIRATAAALRQHPWVNSWWSDDHIRQWHDVHIGVAVAVEDGLITPIVRHADRKTLREIGGEVREMAGRAREKRLKPEEYTGATFSISNLGMFGIDEFTAVINPPEAGILAVGRLEQKPAVVDGALVVRRRMRITLSCDHRVIDGATGAAFLKTLVGMLENPLAMVW
ncbi:MAG: dihydrolipoamide acetyltransferase family protein [Gemmatimonadales bacterium]|nr:dihydrolipoamide acetyltransferase family protein [Gemmatimonadales bacterium]